MIIGIPSEVKDDEYRVAITPAGVRELTAAGNQVLVEKGAGVGSSITDADYVATGATIVDDVDDVWATADLVLKVKEPIASEYGRLGARKDQVLFTYLHLAASLPCTEALVAAGNTAIAYETVRLADNSLPLLTPMSEVAGRMAPLMGAHHLMRSGGGRGALICGVPGVAAANVVVLGAGVAGMAAATASAISLSRFKTWPTAGFTTKSKKAMNTSPKKPLLIKFITASSLYQGKRMSTTCSGSNLAGITVTTSPRASLKPTTLRTRLCRCSISSGV